jgi:copper chaperone
LRSALIFILMLTTTSIAAEQIATIIIEGMTCNGCVTSVTNALQKIDGIQSADVQLKPGCAVVVYDDAKADPARMMDAIAALGYKASMADKSVGAATHCDTHAKEAVSAPLAKAETKPAVAKGGCPMAARCKEAGTKVKCGTATTSLAAEPMVKPAVKAETDHACITLTQCKQLNDFHEAMHPLHEALGNGDYTAVRAGYAGLADKAKAVGTMKCDKSCVKDVNAFEKYRQNLLTSVDRLGDACKQTDDRKLAEAFEKMHDAYNELSQQAK